MSSHIANDGFAMLKPEVFLRGRKPSQAAADAGDAIGEYIQKIPNPDDPEGGRKGKRKGGKKNKKNRKKSQSD